MISSRSAFLTTTRGAMAARNFSPTVLCPRYGSRPRRTVPRQSCHSQLMCRLSRLRNKQGPTARVSAHSCTVSLPRFRSTVNTQIYPRLQSWKAAFVGAKVEEIEAAIVAVTAALRHPLIQRAQAAVAKGKCYRELPLALRMDDGSLIEGAADLVFWEDGGWIVVDFKTDRELTNELERYRRQVSIYARAISQAHTASCGGFLFGI
jgi:hypothetical protein